jgi:thiamine monophosphate synthase
MDATIQAISSAVETGKVALVSVRIVLPQHVTNTETFEHRVVDLTRRLVALRVPEGHPFRVVVSSDWVSAAIRACAHGVHVKENDQWRIPDIRKQFAPRVPLIGTSAHSVASALEATSLYQPDYLFVGTCFATESHPEKVELEGPALPGTVCSALLSGQTARPVVLAIGGMDEHNCHVPVAPVHGADGVAAIRSVLLSSDPRRIVELMHRNMRENFVAEGK